MAAFTATLRKIKKISGRISPLKDSDEDALPHGRYLQLQMQTQLRTNLPLFTAIIKIVERFALSESIDPRIDSIDSII
jgi:hypothetical protein